MKARRAVFRSPWAAFMSGALLMGLAQMVGQRALHNYGASEENEAHPRALLRRQRVDPSQSAATQVERARVAPEELSPRPSPSSPAVGSFRPSLSLSSSPATGSAVRRRSLEQLPPPSASPPARPPIRPAASPSPSNPAASQAAKPASNPATKRRAAAAAAVRAAAVTATAAKAATASNDTAAAARAAAAAAAAEAAATAAPASSPRPYLAWLSEIDREAQRQGLNRSRATHLSGGQGGQGDMSAGEQRRRKCRRFKVGRRKDYQTSIRAALEALGLCETTSDRNFDLFWGEEYQASP